MKRRRDIILDFTSLLDVIMIILFYFILYSHFEANEAKLKMEAAQSAADERITVAEQREQDAQKRIEQAASAEQKALDAYNRLSNENQRGAQNYDALKAFEEGRQLRLHLIPRNGTWLLFFVQGGYSYTAQIEEGLPDAFSAAFETFDYTADSTILCEFSFDASARGSKAAYDTVSRELERLRKQYPYLYISEYDESKRRELEHE